MSGTDRKTQRFQDVDFNVNIKQMTQLMAVAAKSSNRDVKDLAKQINEAGIDKVTGAHSGGMGGGGREADPEQHCTVKAGKNNYHVYLKQKNGAWMIIKITS